MKIIKRNGAEETFDRQKIKDAIAKANNETDGTPELTARQIDYISLVIEDHCNEMNRALSVEEIQELVETHIILQGAPETAKRYIRYRFTRNLARASNTTDNQILSLIECNNEEVKQENSNKNPTVNSVQRDYMAGEVSKDLTKRILLPEDSKGSRGRPYSLPRRRLFRSAYAQLRPCKFGGYAPKRYRYFGYHDRKASFVFYCLQYSYADNSTGCFKSVRRSVDFTCAFGSVRSDFA